MISLVQLNSLTGGVLSIRLEVFGSRHAPIRLKGAKVQDRGFSRDLDWFLATHFLLSIKFLWMRRDSNASPTE